MCSSFIFYISWSLQLFTKVQISLFKNCRSGNVRKNNQIAARYIQCIYIDILVSVIIYFLIKQFVYLNIAQLIILHNHGLRQADSFYDYRCLFNFLDNNRFLSDLSKHQSRADHSIHSNIIHNAISNVWSLYLKFCGFSLISLYLQEKHYKPINR
jgi:hypothetical protein